MSGDVPVQLATRLPDWSAGGLLRCSAFPRYLCVVSFSKFHEPNTRDLLRTSSRHVTRIPRRCYEETAPVEFQLYGAEFEKCWAHSPQRAASRPFSRCR